MIKTEILQLFSIYTLLLFSKFHATISLSPVGIIDVAHESATGITDAHDAGAVKSTIELAGERVPHSQPQPCRRSMAGCFPGFLRSSTTSARTSQAGIRGGETAEGTRAGETFAKPRSWTFSIASKFRRVRSKLLFGFYPATRDNWNLVHASYEEILASAIRSKSGWGDDGNFAANLADLRTARRQSTATLGLHPYVRQYILKIEIPNLHQDLVKSLDKVLKNLLRDGGGRGEAGSDMGSKVAIINKFFKAELQDPELAPYLGTLKGQLDKLNALHPSSDSTAVPESLSSAQLPLKPSFSNLGKLKIPPEQSQSTRNFWEDMSCEFFAQMFAKSIDQLNAISPSEQPTDQFNAERNHLRYLIKIDKPILQEWTRIEQLTAEFGHTTSPQAWGDKAFHPNQFTISEYKNLKAIGAARRPLIQKATLASKASYYQGQGIDDAEILIRRKLELESLLIQSFGERLDEVKEIVQGLVDGSDTTARHYLTFIDNFNSRTMNLGRNPDSALAQLRMQVQLPNQPSATRQGRRPPSRPTPQLNHVDPQSGYADPENPVFHGVSFREGGPFDRYSPDAQQQFVESTLLQRISR
ncbi:uncharacterized protein MELLADRAFT_70300 [Melampsora larici-populina 98AG31]|uniref:Secreted protein n=1 Tax=Melampsora larici-populina (strain 98AG31 / pathotype 3-4-7) TaxID=747676 RepID=F4SEE3_MELLP|nr:uncharacterized protein MELLADRAFT_70300 [Melampsora larici-populina 98AG31]EGF96983.1 hypothetical protein MELLADRAFT_70300 [Melampsora larici-populina 98AG31]